jgi:hypothetical protein
VSDLAKSVATLDFRRMDVCSSELCGMECHRARGPPRRHRVVVRYTASDECVGALRAWLGHEESDCEREFFRFEEMWSVPKPTRLWAATVCR